MRTSSDVHNYLTERGIAHEMLPLPDECVTAEGAAELLGVPVGDVVKSRISVLEHETRALQDYISNPY